MLVTLGTCTMKRSEINHEINTAIALLERHGFALPPFAHWSPQRWREIGPEADEIRSAALGWDVTDFGKGDFARLGLTVFTLRNGNLGDANNTKVYAEKILIVEEDQVTPYHYHFAKMEDIINRGGGRLVIDLHNSDAAGGLADSPVTVRCDGVLRTVPAGGGVTLDYGESITLIPGVYHQFKAEKGHGPVLAGEVSSVNDDNVDNRFLEELPRFPSIVEDEPAVRLLCNEYPPTNNQ